VLYIYIYIYIYDISSLRVNVGIIFILKRTVHFSTQRFRIEKRYNEYFSEQN